MQKLTAECAFSRETANTVKYDEIEVPGKPPIVRNVYIAKWALPRPFPQKITVTVEA